MRRSIFVALMAGLLAIAMAVPALAQGKSDDSKGRPGPGPMIYVTGQGLYYDSIVKTDLPMHGPFQQLIPTMTEGLLETEFGPGDQGFVGGRWWLDNLEGGIVGEQDAADAFFLCPLLGPGRSTP